MGHLLRFLLLFSWIGTMHAQSPPINTSPAAFAGEWAGTGEQGSYCYVTLTADGWGRVLVDGGAGDWLGARIQWSNRQQALLVERIIPSLSAPRLRVMPLDKLVLRSGFNQSMTLSWNDRIAACQLQRIAKTAGQLDRARSAAQALQAGEAKR